MKEILVWNDFCIGEKYSAEADDLCRHLFGRKFCECNCIYVGYAETMEWLQELPKRKGVSIGKRPRKMWMQDASISVSRHFDARRHVTGYNLDEEELIKSVNNALKDGKLVIHEDAIVEGKTLEKLLDLLAKYFTNKQVNQIDIYVLAALEKNVRRLQEKYPYIKVFSKYWLSGKTEQEWESTILFLSDMLEADANGKMFVEDQHRFCQCFYDEHEAIVKQCKRLKQELEEICEGKKF